MLQGMSAAKPPADAAKARLAEALKRNIARRKQAVGRDAPKRSETKSDRS